MDDISALLGLGVEDAQKTQMLANSLRGRKDAADRFALSTIGNISQGAQGEQGAIMAGAQQAGGLRKALQDREQRAQQANLTRAQQAEQAALDRESREKIAQGRLTNALEIANLDNMADAGDDMDVRARQVEQDTRAYSRDLQKSNLPRTLSSLDALETALMDLLPKDENGAPIGTIDDVTALVAEGKNIPGVGGPMNLPYIGGAWTLAGDAVDVLTGDKDAPSGSNIRSARQALFNQEIKLQSGAAVTLPEMLRNQIALGSEVWNTDKDFLAALPRIREGIKEVMKNYNAGYGPEVVDLYNKRQEGGHITAKDYLSGAEQPAATDMPGLTAEQAARYRELKAKRDAAESN